MSVAQRPRRLKCHRRTVKADGAGCAGSWSRGCRGGRLVCGRRQRAGGRSLSEPGPAALIPGDPLISRSDYVAASNLVAGTRELPPGCGPSDVPADPCTAANTSGSAYP